jgi:hypothetical protein
MVLARQESRQCDEFPSGLRSGETLAVERNPGDYLLRVTPIAYIGRKPSHREPFHVPAPCESIHRTNPNLRFVKDGSRS